MSVTRDPLPEKTPDQPPWYIDGVRFECTACGKCCVNHGEGFDYVFSTRSERKALAEHFGMPLKQFERAYCVKVAGQWSFGSKGDACIFLEGGRCSVYELRPKQCRTFPFWPELMESRDTWDRDVASFCPGADTGRLHEFKDIRARLAEQGE